MSTFNNGARMPSPQEAANGLPQAGASGARYKSEEEPRAGEPGRGKKAHREILDHERKRRVELKCMELQEMMEEQGYAEEEIRQKVGTFRQMLMEKEGVLTREDQHGRHIVIQPHHPVEGEEPGLEYPPYGDDSLLECNCPSDCYRGDGRHREYRTTHRSSSSISPPPKKKKKKKSGHRRNRKKRKVDSDCSFDSSSPQHKRKRTGIGKRHRRDRSESGSRRKRRYRTKSPKNKRKERNKERKRPPSESPARRGHRRSSCSSRRTSLSSDSSSFKSPSRLSPKHREDGPKPSSRRSSGSRSSSSPGHSRSATPHQNGHRGGAHNGRSSQGRASPPARPQDVRTLCFCHGSSSLPPSPTPAPIPPVTFHHRTTTIRSLSDSLPVFRWTGRLQSGSLPPAGLSRRERKGLTPSGSSSCRCPLPVRCLNSEGNRAPLLVGPPGLGRQSGSQPGGPRPSTTDHPPDPGRTERVTGRGHTFRSTCFTGGEPEAQRD
uniref:CWF21 domain-containing protein n=1 Tax=Ornithorhynchus anatinus TaxID=9258 RepID=A0A6I8NSU9_ORNAN